MKSETKYRIIADGTYDFEFWVNPQGRFVYASPSSKRITGYDAKDFIEDPNLRISVIHPDDRGSMYRHIEEDEKNREPSEIEYRLIRADGSIRWISHACQPIFSEEGEYLGVRGSNRDITQRKRTEEALRESEKRLRLVSSQLLVAQEKERKLVAQEIHDGIGASLTAAKFKLESALNKIGDGNPQARVVLESVIPLIQGTMGEARRIQMSLRPPILDEIGILATIEWFCEKFESTYTNITVRKEIDIAEEDVPKPLKTVLYMVLQEALNNVAKHSKADSVNVSLRKMDGAIELEIQDNGQGFDPGEAQSRIGTTRGLGLDSMRERAELWGGSFSIESRKGAGTVIRATWAN